MEGGVLLKLFDAANRFCQESTWKTIAALKFCLLSLGVIIGMLLPKSWELPVVAVCAAVFVITYIPLMLKLLRIVKTM